MCAEKHWLFKLMTSPFDASNTDIKGKSPILCPRQGTVSKITLGHRLALKGLNINLYLCFCMIGSLLILCVKSIVNTL